jgi:ADP-heptose:LPS heptosyltransferase
VFGFRLLLRGERAFDYLFQQLARVIKTARPASSKRPKAVLIKSLGGIGDYLLMTPTFRSYRDLFKDYRIVLLVRKRNEELANENPFVDAVILVRYEVFRRRMSERLRLWWKLLQENIEVLINADYSTAHEFLDETIAKWSLAPRKIAFQCLDGVEERTYSSYSTLVPQTRRWMFEIDRNFEIVRFLGSPAETTYSTLIWGLDTHSPTRPEIGRLTAGTYYIVFPGSSMRQKSWPLPKFVELLDSLSGQGLLAVVCGGESEKDIAASICRDVRVQVLNLAGRTGLLDLAHLIKNSRFVISNDTSAVHIAASCHVQSFVILGGGHYARFLPYPNRPDIETFTNFDYERCFGCHWRCIYDRPRCITEVDVKSVTAAIVKFVERENLNGN